MSWSAVNAPFTLKRPFTLKSGVLYACTYKLSFVEKHLATEELIAQRFTDAGFTGVTVDMDASRAEGTWGKPDQDDVSLPDEVVTVWSWDAEATQP